MSKAQRYLVIAIWLSIILAFWLYVQTSPKSLTEILQGWLSRISSSAWGPLLLLGVFAVRPVLLLPVAILNMFLGFLFGPLWGSVYAVAATMMSASIPYGLARFFAKEAKQTNDSKLVRNMREQSFETVLLSRFIFLPGDIVNYAAGFWKISFGAFFLATLIGGLPSLLMTTFAGASIEGDFQFSSFKLNTPYLIVSAALLVFSLLMSYYLRQRTELSKKD